MSNSPDNPPKPPNMNNNNDNNNITTNIDITKPSRDEIEELVRACFQMYTLEDPRAKDQISSKYYNPNGVEFEDPILSVSSLRDFQVQFRSLNHIFSKVDINILQPIQILTNNPVVVSIINQQTYYQNSQKNTIIKVETQLNLLPRTGGDYPKTGWVIAGHSDRWLDNKWADWFYRQPIRKWIFGRLSSQFARLIGW